MPHKNSIANITKVGEGDKDKLSHIKKMLGEYETELKEGEYSGVAEIKETIAEVEKAIAYADEMIKKGE